MYNTYLYFYLYFFIINITFTTHCLYVSRNYANCKISTISRKLCSPFAQHFFSEMHVGDVSDAVQFVFVESSSNRLSARIFQKIRAVLVCCTLIILNTSFNSCNLYQKLSWIYSRVPNHSLCITRVWQFLRDCKRWLRVYRRSKVNQTYTNSLMFARIVIWYETRQDIEPFVISIVRTLFSHVVLQRSVERSTEAFIIIEYVE